MNRLINVIVFMSIFSLTVHATSQDELSNYQEIKSKLEKSDKELNILYKSQIDEYKKEGGAFYGQNESRDIYLKKSQQAWIKIKDANCAYETYESKKGTGFQSIYLQCLLEKTNSRIEYLKRNN